MAEATVILKLSPREYDVLREALDAEYKRALEIADGRDIKAKGAARRLSVELGDLLGKLR